MLPNPGSDNLKVEIQTDSAEEIEINLLDLEVKTISIGANYGNEEGSANALISVTELPKEKACS